VAGDADGQGAQAIEVGGPRGVHARRASDGMQAPHRGRCLRIDDRQSDPFAAHTAFQVLALRDVACALNFGIFLGANCKIINFIIFINKLLIIFSADSL
jgi:hypothetical protein